MLPTINTKQADDTFLDENEIFDLQIIMMAANRGNAQLAMPVKEGDPCIILYCDRSLGDYDDSDGQTVINTDQRRPLGRNPIAAICCSFTLATPIPIDPENVYIKNGNSQITIEPSGRVIVDTPSDHIINAGGDFIVNASSAIINCDTTINGNETVNGNEDVSGVITAPDIKAADSLTVKDVEQADHDHGGVERGNERTDPVGE